MGGPAPQTAQRDNDLAPPVRDPGQAHQTDPGLAPDPKVTDRSRATATAALGGGAATFSKTTSAASGTSVMGTSVDLSLVPPEYRGAADPASKVAVRVLVEGSRFKLELQIGPDYWIASLSPEQLIKQLAGSAATELLSVIANVEQFVQELAKHVVENGTRLRINLTPNSFVVIDLAHVVRKLGEGQLVLHPVEMQLMAGKVAGLRVFRDQDVSAKVALHGTQIGGWFEVPDADGRMRSLLGPDDESDTAKKPPSDVVFGGVFVDGGTLRFAIKESEKANAGAVLHVDFEQLFEHLKKLGKALGAKFEAWLAKLRLMIGSGDFSFLRLNLGNLHLGLPSFPGISFDFNLGISLPRLFGGGGGASFDWSKLVPSFQFDMGSWKFGALPKLKFPWLSMPKLGGGSGWHLKLPDFKGLIPSLPDFDLEFDLGVHWIGDFRIGIGVDLSGLIPDLPDFALGFELDLQLIAGASAVGKWLLEQWRKLMRAGGKVVDFFKKWVHLGRDGVLRIYDDTVPDGHMLGFHLRKLLDGAQPSDLLPTEMRWNQLAMGEAGDGAPGPDEPSDKMVVHKPGKPLGEGHVPANEHLAEAMSLKKGAEVTVGLYRDGTNLVLITEAQSELYKGNQAARIGIDVAAALAAARKHLQKKPEAHVEKETTLELDETTFVGGLRIAYAGPKSSGYLEWTYAQLANPSWDNAMPEHFGYTLKDSFGLGRGPVPTSPAPVAGDRLQLASPRLRHSILGKPEDKRDDVYGMIHLGDGQVGVSITDEATSNIGAYAHVSPKFLLEQLKRLGKIGASLLGKIAKLVNFTLPAGGDSDPFAFLDGIAEKLLAAWDRAKAMLGKLRLESPDFGFLQWDLALQLPHLGDLDLTKLIPEFDLKFELPKIGKLDISLDLFDKFKIGNPIGSLPNFKLPAFLSGLHLPSLPDLSLEMFSDLSMFSIAIRFPDLFGDGQARGFGFHIPIQKLLEKAAAAAKWLAKHTPNPNVHLGADGILRIYDHANGNRVGYDITKLFDGFSPDDLIPVELHAGMGGPDEQHALVTLDYGRQASREAVDAATAPSKEDPKKTNDEQNNVAGRVLVARPPGLLLAANVKAPGWLVEHLGLKAKKGDPQIHASLHYDKTGVTVFATADGHDQGVALHINVDKFPNLLDIDILKGKTKGSIRFDEKLSMNKGMLVIAFGPKPAKPGDKVDELHGHLGWKLDKLLDSPTLESLLPDEFEIGRKEGEIEASNALDITGLEPTAKGIDLSGFPLVESALGGNTKVDVYTKMKGSPRIAITVASNDPPDHAHPRQGVEIELDERYKQKLDTQIKTYADKMKGAVSKVFNNTSRAGDVGSMKNLKLTLGATGLGVERGLEGEQDHMYARFHWGHVAHLVTSDSPQAADLIPDEFRLATSSMAIEVKEHVAEEGKPKETEVPNGTPLVSQLHPLLQEPLAAAGVPGERYVALDLNASHVVDEAGNLRGIIHLYETEKPTDPANKKIAHEKDIILTLNVEALIAQVMPSRSRKFQKDKPEKLDEAKRGKKTSFSASIHGTRDLNKDGKETDPGVELTAGLHSGTNAKHRRDLDIEVGWSATKVLELILKLDNMLDGEGEIKTGGVAGLLVPDHVKGSFSGDKFRISFSNENHHGPEDYSFDPSGTGIDDALASVFDPETAKHAMIYLNLPDPGKTIGDLGSSVVSSKFVDLAHCMVEVPDGQNGKKYYDVGLAFEPHLFRTIIGLIPGLGTFVKIADVAIGIIKDPKGTLEGLRYAPEALVNVVKNAPQIFGALKDMGFKKAITMFMFNSDVTTKQSVMMARYLEALEAAGVQTDKRAWKDLPEEEKKRRAQNLKVPQEVWEYLSKQDGNALRALAKAARENNSPAMTEPLDPTIPDHQLTVPEIELGALQAQLKYEALEQTMEAEQAEQDPAKKAALRKQMDEYSNAIRAQLEDMTKNKVKGTAVANGTNAPLTKPPGVIDYSENLPTPDQADEDSARELFDPDRNKGKPGTAITITGAEADYMIRKYAGLTSDQLGSLLMGESVKLELANTNAVVVMRPSERSFVRTLWVKRIEAEGYKVKRSGTSADVTPEIDQAAVSAWRASKARQKVDADADAAAAARDAKIGGGKPTDPGGGNPGQGTGGGRRPSADNLVDEDAEGEGAGGQGGTGGTQDGGDGTHVEPTPQNDGGGGAVQPDKPEEKKSPYQEFHQSDSTARGFITFDRDTGTLALNETRAAEVVGMQLKYDEQPVIVKGVALKSVRSEGKDEKQVFEFVLSISLDGASIGGSQVFDYTYVYTPATDNVGSWGSGYDPTDLINKLAVAVTITGTGGAPSEHPTFDAAGKTWTIRSVSNVEKRNEHLYLADLRVAFTNVKEPFVAKGPNGELQRIEGDGEATMRLPIEVK
jgi:hypothetical protein